MPYIDLPADLPGIVSLFAFRPETARPLRDLAETLLRAESSLSRGDRELIAAYVSALNECEFCTRSHAAFAAAQLDGGRALLEQVLHDPDTAPITPKLRALCRLAGAVQRSGRAVTATVVAAARSAGASDVEIHDTVLIAAAFCMFNRYVDGLGAWTPDDPERYVRSAELIVSHGYAGRLGTIAEDDSP